MKKIASLLTFSLLAIGIAFFSSCNKDEPAPPPSCENFAVVVAQQGNNQLIANATSGTTPYTYVWSSGATDQVITLDSSFAGDYGVTVTDANGCTAENTFSITADPCTSFQAMTTLNGSAIIASQSGGTAPFTYQWNDGSTASSLAIDLAITAEYSVTITDASGCTAYSSFNVSSSNPCDSTNLSLQFGYSPNPAGNTLVVAGSGGQLPYSYLWNTGSTSDMLNGVTAGTYSVTLTDANGCTVSGEYTVATCADFSVDIVQSDSITTVIHFDAVTDGGTSPFTYNWAGSANGDAGFVELPNGTSGSISVTVTDAAGCVAEDTDQF